MKKVKEGYKMTELGEIPNDWRVKSIGEIFEFSGGLSISRAKLTDKGVNYLHYGDIHMRNENYIDTEKDEAWLPKIEDKFEEIKENVKLNSGDVVFADASEDYEGIGKSVAIFNDSEKPFVAGLHTIVAKDINNQLDKNYKRYCFSTNEVRKQFRYLAVGTSVYGISRENIKKIKINIPTIKEQQKIASILSTVDEQIDNVDALIEKNKELKKGLMQTLLTKGIGHTKFKKTEIGEIPEEWEVKELDLIGEIITGSTPKTSEKDNYGNEYLWVSPGDLGIKKYVTNTVKMLSDKGFSKTRKLPKGAILVTCIGSTIGKMGISKTELSTNQQINSIICNDKVNSEFIYYALNYNFNMYTSFISTQAVPIINKTTFGKFLIQVPNIREQIRIVSILSEVDEKIEEHENKKQKLENLKKGLMQQLLTGMIRVTV